jgi:hypothetical protein
MATDDNQPVENVKPGRGLCTLAFALPFVAVGGLLLIYAISPSFYLRYVLNPYHREYQAVEFVTVISALLAALLLAVASARIWRRDRHCGRIPNLPGGAIIIAVIALAAFFFGMEEINWGQTWFGDTSGELESGSPPPPARSLHNTDFAISVQSLGSVFLVATFIGLPIAWRFRKPKGPLPLPEDWQPAIAEWPVLSCFAVAFVWKWCKELYLLLWRDHEFDPSGLVPWFADMLEANEQELLGSGFYMQFIEQINEHKEMLAALGLLLYALYRLREARTRRTVETAA